MTVHKDKLTSKQVIRILHSSTRDIIQAKNFLSGPGVNSNKSDTYMQIDELQRSLARLYETRKKLNQLISKQTSRQQALRAYLNTPQARIEGAK